MMIRSNIRDRCAYKSNPNCFSHTENDPEILFRVVFLFHVRAFHVINHLPAATTKVLNLSRKFWSLNNWVQGVCKCFDSKLKILRVHWFVSQGTMYFVTSDCKAFDTKRNDIGPFSSGGVWQNLYSFCCFEINQIWKVSVVDGFQLQENCAKIIFFWD